MQMQRLLSKKAKRLLEEVHFVSIYEENKSIRKLVPDDWYQILIKLQNAEEGFQQENLHREIMKLLKIENAAKTSNSKFSSDNIGTFKKLRQYPKYQKLITSRIITEKFFKDTIKDWIDLLSNLDSFSKMAEMVTTFDKKTQIKFFRLLA